MISPIFQMRKQSPKVTEVVYGKPGFKPISNRPQSHVFSMALKSTGPLSQGPLSL